MIKKLPIRVNSTLTPFSALIQSKIAKMTAAGAKFKITNQNDSFIELTKKFYYWYLIFANIISFLQLTEYRAAQDVAKKNHSNIWEYGDITEDDANEFGR